MASSSKANNIVKDGMFKNIQTFLFFDLETTDLIRNSKFPNITELAMIATSRDFIKPSLRDKLGLPRVLHKLLIPIRPKTVIQHQVSFISNLWNDDLEKEDPFDENTFEMILKFIKRLTSPVCFVAHNGNRFDYPVFLNEIKQIQKVLPDDILCIDSLQAFREFFSEMVDLKEPAEKIVVGQGHDEVDEEMENREKDFELMRNTSFEDCWNDALYTVLDNFEDIAMNRTELKNNSNAENTVDELDSILKNKNQETTNSSERSLESNLNYDPKKMQAINEKTPKSQIIKNNHTSPITNSNLTNIKKNLKFDSKPDNFKLSTIHKFLLGCDGENFHNAEADCIAMLRCVCQLGPYFVEWADINAVSLNTFFLK